MTVLPPSLVDALPEQLWSLGNLYQFFGQSLHFCVGGDGPHSVRTIKVNDREVGHGRTRFVDFAHAVGDEAFLHRWSFDLGWLVVVGVAAYVAVAFGLRRVLRRVRSRDIRHADRHVNPR